MSQQLPPQFILQSKVDSQCFSVDKKVIEASTLLKNICGKTFIIIEEEYYPLFLEITDITEPIVIDCPGSSLEFYISLIKNYERTEKNEHHKKFEKRHFDTFTDKNKQNLIKLIQDLCILDSDFFLNSAADYILGIFGGLKKGRPMGWNGMRKYLGLESDFSAKERTLILGSEELEYSLSINTPNFTFPFPNKNLYSLTTDFSTPMNILISRIIQRSNASTSHFLSLINKTIKNEIDRHPIKLSEFVGFHHGWSLDVYTKTKTHFQCFLNYEEYPDVYFNTLKKRKVIADEKCKFTFDNLVKKHVMLECSSSEFPISENVKVQFSKTLKSIYNFDVTKIKSPKISYRFSSIDIEKKTKREFKEFYNHLIAKDLSKKISMEFANDVFKFFCPGPSIRFHKKENASKLCKLDIMGEIKKINPRFKEFLTDFMEEDGIIESAHVLPGVPIQAAKEFWYYYPSSILKKTLKCKTF